MRRSFHDAIDIRDFYAFEDDDLEPLDDEFADEDDTEDENGIAEDIEGGEDDDGNGEATPAASGPKTGD